MVDCVLVCDPGRWSNHPDFIASREVVPIYDGPVRHRIRRRCMLIISANVPR